MMSLGPRDITGRIENAFGTCALVGWQFAADGKWDAAKRIAAEPSSSVILPDIFAWLAEQKSGDIALEALFEFGDGQRFFFGLRIQPLDAIEKKRLIAQSVAKSAHGQSLTETMGRIREAARDPDLALADCDYLELGVFDLWNRVKPLVVWRAPDDLATLIAPNAVAAAAQKPDPGFPSLGQPQAKPLMLEAAWRSGPLPCWLSLPVGEQRDEGEYVLSPTAYIRAARILAGRGGIL